MMMRWNPIGMVLVGVVLLSACGAATAASPAAAHTAWVTALQTNDPAALQRLADPAAPAAATLDAELARIQSYVRAGYVAPGVVGGPFVGVAVLPVTGAGAQAVGVSRWRFAQVDLCYATTLAQTPTGWRVGGWRAQAACPSDAGATP